MNELALFAGAGGGILGGKLLGWRTVCAVEFATYAASVLAARQNDGALPPFPIWDDVCTFDGRPWRGRVDVVSGGFPCQDISCAGKGAGIDGERSGLWREMARIVGEVRPRFVFVENSPMLVRRGLAVVLGDLAAVGYDAQWCVLGAHHAGAPHRRDRIWILATDANGKRGRQESKRKPRRCHWSKPWNDGEPQHVADADGGRRKEFWLKKHGKQQSALWRQPDGCCQERRRNGQGQDWWSTEPNVGRVADGVAARMDRLKATGNGQVPAVAALAWRLLTDETKE